MSAVAGVLEAPGPLVWSDAHVLGYAPMDDIHEAFVDIVGRMQLAADDELPVLLDSFVQHAEAHFEEENRWMVDTQFPPRACHIEQHNAVLNSAAEVRALLTEGDHATCRRFAFALADWFPNHTAHLDSALAHWMVKRQHGGKPLVFRTLPAHPETPATL